ncbi:arylsulfatase B-like [Littorina saxatilis]|uniref:Sulfatase N-terminal domain-containing protein n=1 Tax=Littorina saxatilis TaxID=31220 RepID=A0AAN9BNJ1_9CAEN
MAFIRHRHSFFCLLAVVASILTVTVSVNPPNIVLMMLDDMGWADFQSHDPLMVTPNIRKLREEGMFLNQSYVLPQCVPTRGALLTGRYPHTYGLQDGQAIREDTIFYLNENLTTLPQELKKVNPLYQTHMVGKWHLGHCHPGLYPQARGFDSFYGILLGGHQSFYYHNATGNVYDFRDGDNIDWSAWGNYTTDLFHTRAKKILEEDIDYTKPFFFYMSYYAAHKPFEVPQAYRDQYCSHVTNDTRQIHCAMAARADDSIGQLLQVLKDKGVYNNTVILLLSDNGGPALTGSSVNWPLRGTKQTIYEGGTRSYTIVRAPGLAATNVTWPGMIHAIDWLPTLVKAAGGSKPSYVHGKNMWNKLKKNIASPRTEFIYNINDWETRNHSAFRYNEWKLIKGKPGPTKKCGWFPPYQLLLNQSYPWGLDGVKVNDTIALYNIEKDPEERNDVYNDPANAAIVQTIEDQIEKYLGVPGKQGLYPLQPFVIPRLPAGDNVDENGALATCTCHPAGLAASTACT